MATKNEIIRAVLDELNIVSAGQDVSAEDAQAAGARIGYSLVDLASRFLIPDVIWPEQSTDHAVPDHIVAPLIPYLAQECATVFGKDSDEAARLAAESRLRVQMGIADRQSRRFRIDSAMMRVGRGR